MIGIKSIKKKLKQESKMSYTKGEWKIRRTENYITVVHDISHTEVEPVCHLFDNPNAQANAHLISAAPELLEACKKAYESLLLSAKEGTPQYKLLDELQQAINKAEGK
jgi:hypothetical protein